MHITLRPGEKLYLNGAVLRADRKVSIELMNEAAFLLEAHVMHVDKATTPVRQLYFIVQMMLMNPRDTAAATVLFRETMPRMQAAYTDRDVLDIFPQVDKLVAAARYFEGLKLLRSIFARDDVLMAGGGQPTLALAS